MDNKSVFGKDLMRKVSQYQNESPIHHTSGYNVFGVIPELGFNINGMHR